eukprot:TRINITY_DN2310_c0_g2_i3.p2 TRINITY_DN2310_c0_g2~~TRINITY_DN2310_c0_g2_i3.p2  ORF type:complete len:322 (+),score=82.08 TRINITY_DN2310_c0_g2_i3:57-968(+)
MAQQRVVVSVVVLVLCAAAFFWLHVSNEAGKNRVTFSSSQPPKPYLSRTDPPPTSSPINDAGDSTFIDLRSGLDSDAPQSTKPPTHPPSNDLRSHITQPPPTKPPVTQPPTSPAQPPQTKAPKPKKPKTQAPKTLDGKCFYEEATQLENDFECAPTSTWDLPKFKRDSIFYNMGQTLSRRLCKLSETPECSKTLLDVLEEPHEGLKKGTNIMVRYINMGPGGSSGPYAVAYLYKTLLEAGFPALSLHFDKKFLDDVHGFDPNVDFLYEKDVPASEKVVNQFPNTRAEDMKAWERWRRKRRSES